MAARRARRTDFKSVSIPVINRSMRITLANCIYHAFLFTAVGKDRLLRFWPDCAKHRRLEDDAGQQVAHHGWLTDPLHRPTHQSATSSRRSNCARKNQTELFVSCVQAANSAELNKNAAVTQVASLRARARWTSDIRGQPECGGLSLTIDFRPSGEK
jgi:hypothetical protein